MLCSARLPLIRALLAAALAAAGGGTASAQSSGLVNPLRPSNARNAAPAQPAPKAQAPAATDEAPKAKRTRSEAQLANDNRMRLCGKEWRENKAALSAQGKTWRTFNVECRARLKAQGT